MNRAHRNEIFLREHVFISFLNKLMSAANKLEAVDMIELGDNLGAKEPTSTALTH